jgi:hypothetical protein
MEQELSSPQKNPRLSRSEGGSTQHGVCSSVEHRPSTIMGDRHSTTAWPVGPVFTLLLLALVIGSPPAHAQVFSTDRPGGINLVPFATEASLNKWFVGMSGIVGCTGGPNFMLTVATQSGLFAVSDGEFPGVPYVWQIADMADMGDALAGSSVYQINAVAATATQDLIYVGFHPKAWTPAVPILSVDLHGEVAQVVTSAELEEAAGPGAAVFALSVSPDGSLYASMRSQADGTLIRIAPDKPEGERIEVLLTTQDLIADLPAVSHDVPWVWGNTIAADGSGRVFFQADVLPEGQDKPLCVLIRRDEDGSLVEMTGREGEIPALPSYDFNVPDFPCQSTREGLVYDPELDLLVGAGNGMWLISPDEPGEADLVLQPFAIESLVYELVGPDYIHDPVSPMSPGNCLGHIGAQGLRVYGSMRWILYGAALDPLRLDLDKDLLLGEEEAVWGTDPMVADSDGGGIVDGAEVLDHSDPSDPKDDRILPAFSENWSMSARYFGSRFAATLMGSFNRYVVADSAGGLLFSVWGNQPGRVTVAAWTDWDDPAQMLTQGACESHQELDEKGNVLCDYDTTLKSAAKHAPDGTPGVPLVDPAIQDVLIGDSMARGIAARPDGTRFVAYENGRLLKLRPDGTAAVIYDSHEDLLQSGTIDEDDGCYNCCKCSAPLGPIVYEPVRSVVYCWVNFTLYFGGTATSPILVAVLPDDTLKVVAEADIFRPFVAELGGQTVVDMEPDLSGGLWVLLTGGINRSLARLDANLAFHTEQWFRTPVGLTGPGAPGDLPRWALAHADDIVVTSDRRVFLVPMYSYEQYPPYYFPSELVPVEPIVRAGDILSVHPQERGLGKLDPRGGGINLIFEGDLGRPVAVAGTVDKVAVADAEHKSLLVYGVKPDGTLKKPEPLGQIQDPAGLDIDTSGSFLVVDRSAKTVLRIHPDGTQESAVQGSPFVDPRDVVALQPSGFAVTDNAAGAIFLVDAQGNATSTASAPGADALTVIDGLAWVVSTPGDKLPPLRIAPEGQSRMAANINLLNSYLDNPGGLTADSDGNVFWIVTGGFNYDSINTFGGTHVLRLTPDGYMAPMVRSGLPATQTPGDVYVVRPKEALPPRLPGTVAPPPLSPEADEGSDALGSDLLAPETPDGSPSQPSSSGGCTTALVGPGLLSARSATTAPAVLTFLLSALLLSALFLALRLVRPHTVCPALSPPNSRGDESPAELCRISPRSLTNSAIVFLVLSLLACSSPTGSSGDVTNDARTDSIAADTPYVPDTVSPQCEGKDLCPPGSAPVCATATSTRSCHMDADGCFVWSREVACPGTVPCVDGMCKLCFPNCRGIQCGDDGCGGSCGECGGADGCCHGFCAPCKVDCAGKVCGDDGTGGTCGKCPSNFVCSMGKCFQPGTGSCVDFFECSSACPVWSDTCWEDCQAYATNQAQMQVTLLDACTLEQCAPCFTIEQRADALECLDECTLEYCAPEHDACLNDVLPNT